MVFKTKSTEKKTVFETGALRDTQEGKPRYDLIGLHMLRRLALLMERGAANYGERNWEKGQNISRTLASLWRHLVQYQEGDREEDHLSAIVFNAMSMIHVEEEVQRGNLPSTLADLPFYNSIKIEFNGEVISGSSREYPTSVNTVQALEVFILQYMQYQLVTHGEVELSVNELQQEVAPTRLRSEVAIAVTSLLKQGKLEYLAPLFLSEDYKYRLTPAGYPPDYEDVDATDDDNDDDQYD